MVPAAAAAAVVGALLVYLLADGGTFHSSACSNIEAALEQEVVGQQVAIQQLVEAICHHLQSTQRHGQQQQRQGQPLIISVHGPPGVGKTYSHQLLARALYSSNYTQATRCPGPHCGGYKVYYGMDYTAAEQAQRLAAVAESLRVHLARAPDALIVVEEYDKLDCAARGLWRQLLQSPEVHGLRWDRAIVLLESNLGMADIINATLAAAAAGGPSPSAEAWQELLRGLVFSRWRAQGCEGYEDTLKMTSLVNFWLPYLPLGGSALRQLMERGLEARRSSLAAAKRLELAWDPGVVDWLLSKVEMDAGVALDGAKSVESVLTRHVGRALRKAPAAPHGSHLQQVLRLSIDPQHQLQWGVVPATGDPRDT